MTRRDIHFSTTPERARELSLRQMDEPVVLVVHALKARNAGAVFNPTERKRFLAGGIA